MIANAEPSSGPEYSGRRLPVNRGREMASNRCLHTLLHRLQGRPALCDPGQSRGVSMVTSTLSFARAQPTAAAAMAIAVVGVATILGAYYFQYVLGLPPCPLCLEQRIAYYFAIPLAAMILLGLS